MRRLCLFYKVVLTKLPVCIYDFVPPIRQSQRNPNIYNSFSCRTEYFKDSFFPRVIGEWNKLNSENRSSSNNNFGSRYYILFDQVQVSFIISIIRSALNR